MSINPVMAMKNNSRFLDIKHTSSAFKMMLDQKKAEKNMIKPPDLLLDHVMKGVIKNHEAANSSIKTFMTRTNYTPDRLLEIQYKTGMLFLREQMFCKTAELSANTFKNFTQMQV